MFDAINYGILHTHKHQQCSVGSNGNEEPPLIQYINERVNAAVTALREEFTNDIAAGLNEAKEEVRREFAADIATGLNAAKEEMRRELATSIDGLRQTVENLEVPFIRCR